MISIEPGLDAALHQIPVVNKFRWVEAALPDDVLDGCEELVRHECDGVGVDVDSNDSTHERKNSFRLIVTAFAGAFPCWLSSSSSVTGSLRSRAVMRVDLFLSAAWTHARLSVEQGSDSFHSSSVGTVASAASLASSPLMASSPYRQ